MEITSIFKSRNVCRQSPLRIRVVYKPDWRWHDFKKAHITASQVDQLEELYQYGGTILDILDLSITTKEPNSDVYTTYF